MANIIKSIEDIKELVKYIQSSDVIAFDVEADGLNTRKNKVIGFSISKDNTSGYYFPIYQWNKHKQELEELTIESQSSLLVAKKFLPLLKGKKLIMHNGSYDTTIVKNNLGIDLTDSLYCDTILLYHTLNEDGVPGVSSPFGLKEIGVYLQQELGLDVSKQANEEQIELKKNVQDNGGSITKSNFEIYKADLDVLSKYAIKDTQLTISIFDYLFPKLIEEGLYDFFFFDEVMPLYKEVTIPMERNGVKLDLDLITSLDKDIQEDLELYKIKVIEELRPNQDFKNYLLDKISKEFPPKNKGKFAYLFLEKYYNGQVPLPKTKNGYSLSKTNLEKIEDVKVRSFLIDGDFDLKDKLFLEVSLDLWKEKNNGVLNLNSSTQLSELAFDYLGLKPDTYTDNGSAQFNQAFIESIAKKYAWAENIRVFRRLQKIKSSYIDRLLERHEDGRYYFYYKQHGTISGRYGSDAQQLPRPIEEGDEENETILKYVNSVRAFFIADPGRVFIDCDYESLEPHIFAHVSGDEGLRDIFRGSDDFYSTIAIATENLQGVSADKKASNYLKKVDPEKRRKSKAYCLGVPYGMTDYALSKTLNIPVKEASKLIKNYLDAYPKLREWMDSSKKQAQEFGYVKTQVGRVRHLDKVKKLHERFGEDLLDNKYREELIKSYGKDKVLNWYRDYKNGINNSRNFQIQSLASSIVNRSAIKINRKFKELGINGLVVAQIHDQIISDVPEDKADIAKQIVQECMENIIKLSISLKAPPELSYNWKEGH